MATPTSAPRPLTGDNLFDAMTTGYYWLVGADRTINWSVANGFNGEVWYNAPAVASGLSSLFSSIGYYINLKFNYVGYFSTPQIAYNAGSDITLSLDHLYLDPTTWAVGFFPNAAYNTSLYQGAPGDIFININSQANYLPSYSPGSAGYALALHEIGHALGLKHPFDDGGTGHPTFNNVGFPDVDWTTVMSYTDSYQWNLIAWEPATYMALDVLALQILYGPNTQTNAGDTKYSLTETGYYSTIWDAAGNDTLDASSGHQAWSIYLPNFAPSSLISTKVGFAYLTAESGLPSPGTLYWVLGDVENIIGSAFNDTLSGNGADNFISGGAGNDLIYGDAGNDTAFFSGTASQYTITHNGSTYTIADSIPGRNGTDTLTSIEYAVFSDQTIQLSATTSTLTAAAINTIYQNVAQRDATTAEKSAYVNASSSGALTDTQIVSAIVGSSEVQTYVAPIIRTYQAAFGRVPDKAGLNINVDAIAGNPGSPFSGPVDIVSLSKAFVVSQEFSNIYNGGVLITNANILPSVALIQAFYQNVLGRAGSSFEIAAWQATGQSAAQVLVGFAQSAEFANNVASDITAFLTKAAWGTQTYTGVLEAQDLTDGNTGGGGGTALSSRSSADPIVDLVGIANNGMVPSADFAHLA